MSDVQRRIDRLRARARRGEVGADDGQGAVADARPAPAATTRRPPTSPATQPPGSLRVPRALDIAAAWSWRVVVIALVLVMVGWLLSFFAVLVVPIAIALLITALVIPAVDRLERQGLKRALATAIVLLGVLGFIAGALTLVGQQLAAGFSDLAAQVAGGIEKIETWLRTGPLDLTQQQLTDGLQNLREALTSSDSAVVDRVTAVGTTVGHVVGGFFLVLFATFFFLYDGQRIWSWVVRLFPRDARIPADGAGRASWVSLTAFVRATVLVAFVDAVGITLIALILQVPLAFPIGVLVFLTAFVPIVGAFISGLVAVLVALVAHGPLIALFMLIGVILVQQLESHVLQPFLLGRAVRLHPLAVIFAIAAGVLAGGVIGALVAVPLVAVLNTAVSHLAGGQEQVDRLARQ